MHTTVPGFTVRRGGGGFWDLNLGLHCYTANSLPTELSLQPLVHLLKGVQSKQTKLCTQPGMGGSMPVAETYNCSLSLSPSSCKHCLQPAGSQPYSKTSAGPRELRKGQGNGLNSPEGTSSVACCPWIHPELENSCPNSLDPYLVLEGKEETVAYHTTLAS